MRHVVPIRFIYELVGLFVAAAFLAFSKQCILTFTDQ